MTHAQKRTALPSLVLLALAGACAQRSATPTERSRPSEFRAPGEGAQRYSAHGGDGDALRGPHAVLVGRGIARAASGRGHPLEPDPRLAELAAWVLQHLDPQGSPPPYAVIELWARHLGLYEPTPHLILLGHSDVGTLEQRLSEEITRLLPQQRYTHYGAVTAERDGAVRVALVLSWRWATLEPLPRSVREQERLTLRGRLLPGLSGAQLVVSYPDGRSERGPLEPKPDFAFAIETRGKGPHQVELLSTSRLGTTVVANFPLYVGVKPPTSVTAASSDEGDLDEREVQDRLLALVNRDRAAAGLRPLELHDRLSAVARAHSVDMEAHGFVGHTSPTHGSAVDRVTRAGVRTQVVLENIGRGYGPSEIHRGLMDSPGHRANVLSPDVTHVGIGVLPAPEDDRTAYLVTEVFVRLAAKIDTGRAPAALLDSVNRERARRGLQPLERDERLSALCAATAAEYFTAEASRTQRQMTEQLNRKAVEKPGRYTRVGALLTVVTALEDAATISALLDPKARGVGLGVSQGTRADSIENAIAVAVLLGY
jgi:uncharacterized protein YkwD